MRIYHATKIPRAFHNIHRVIHSFCAENAAIHRLIHKLWTNCVVEFTALSTAECKPVDILSDRSRFHVTSRSIYLAFNVLNAISPLIRPLRAGFCGVSRDLYCKIISSLFRIFIHLYFSDFGLLFCIYAPSPTVPHKKRPNSVYLPAPALLFFPLGHVIIGA